MKKRQRLLQQRLAKARQSFNNLVAALIKASTSASDLVKPEPEADYRLPEIRAPLFTLNLDSRECLQHVGLPPRVLHRERLFQMSPLTLQRLTRSLQVECVMPRREAALLWVLPRRTGSFARVGCQLQPPERTLFLFIPLGKPLHSLDSSGVLLAQSPLTDSKSIALEPLDKKRFPEALPSLGLPSAAPVARRPAADQKAPIAKPLKPVSPLPVVADNPPRVEQLSSDDRTEWIDREVIPNIHYRQKRDSKLRRVSQPFRRASGFIGKPFHPSQKYSFRQNLSGAKKRRQSCLGHSVGSRLQIRGGSPAARAGLSRRRLQLIGTEYLKGFYRRSLERSAGQCRFSENPEASCIDSHRQKFTPAAVVEPTLIADNRPGAEQLSSDDRTGQIARKAIPTVYYQRDYKLPRAGQPFRRASGFIRKPFYLSQKYSFDDIFEIYPCQLFTSAAAIDSPLIADNQPGVEQLSSDDKTGLANRKAIPTYHQRVCKLPRVSQPFRRASGFIGKPFYLSQKCSFRQNLSGAKKRRQPLSHSVGSHLRIRGGSPAANAGLSRRLLQLFGKESLKGKGFHRQLREHRDGLCRFKGSSAAEPSSSDDRIGRLREFISTVHYRKWMDRDLPTSRRPFIWHSSFMGGSYYYPQMWHRVRRSMVKQLPTPDIALGDATIAVEGSLCHDCIAANQLILQRVSPMAVTCEVLIEAMSLYWSDMPLGYYYRTCPPTCQGAHSPLPITQQFVS